MFLSFAILLNGIYLYRYWLNEKKNYFEYKVLLYPGGHGIAFL